MTQKIVLNNWKCSIDTGPTAQVVALYAAVKGRTIIVGDLMKSVGMYHYNDELDTLTHVAKEYDGASLVHSWFLGGDFLELCWLELCWLMPTVTWRHAERWERV